MRKGAITILMFILLCTAVAADLNWVNNAPVNGSTIPGSMTETFDITINETITSAFLYLNSAGPYAMNMNGMNANTTRDTAVLTELNWYNFYYIINGFISPTYSFYLDKVPSSPTWTGSPYVSTESSVTLYWNANPESDISSYNVYRNGSLLSNVPGTTHSDFTVSVGEVWSYTISSVDGLAQESTQSTPQVVTIQDATPPIVPTISPPSGSTYNTFTPIVNLSYGENVSLKVYSGSTMIQNLGWCVACQWNPTFTSDGSYLFTFMASDASSNTRETNYSMTIDTIVTNVTVSIADTIHLIGGDNPTVVKGSALSTTPSDYWLLSFDLSMFGGDYVRATMADLVSASQNIDITSDSAPFIFCEEDYDSVAQDFDGSGNTYNVENNYNEGVNALTCTDTDPTGEVQYKVYMKIPVPSGLTSDSFDLNYEFGLYSTII